MRDALPAALLVLELFLLTYSTFLIRRSQRHRCRCQIAVPVPAAADRCVVEHKPPSHRPPPVLSTPPHPIRRSRRYQELSAILAIWLSLSSFLLVTVSSLAWVDAVLRDWFFRSWLDLPSLLFLAEVSYLVYYTLETILSITSCAWVLCNRGL